MVKSMEDPCVFGFKCGGKYLTQYDFLDVSDLDHWFEVFIKDMDHKNGWEQLKSRCEKVKIVDGDGDFTESYLGRHGGVMERIHPIQTFLEGIFEGRIKEMSTATTSISSQTYMNVGIAYIIDLDDHKFKIMWPEEVRTTNSYILKVKYETDLGNIEYGKPKPNWELEIIKKTDPKYYEELMEDFRGLADAHKRRIESENRPKLNNKSIISTLEKIDNYQTFDEMLDAAKKNEWTEELFNSFMIALDKMPDWNKLRAFYGLISAIKSPEFRNKMHSRLKSRFLTLLESFPRGSSYGKYNVYVYLLRIARRLELVGEFFATFLKYLDNFSRFDTNYKKPFNFLVHTVKKTGTLEEHLPDFFKFIDTIPSRGWKEVFTKTIEEERKS